MNKKKIEFSKKLILDIRVLLWIISIGGILLGFYCVYKEFDSSLGWITTLVGLPWASHATVCSLYLNKSKAENTSANGEGIIFAAAQAKGFMEEYSSNVEKYAAGAEYVNEESNEENYEEETTLDDYDINSPPI